MFLSKQKDVKGIVFDCTEKDIFILDSYSGFTPPPAFKINHWEELGKIMQTDHPNYVVIFSESKLEEHLSTLAKYVGEAKVIKHINASLVDQVLHFLNPKRNRTAQSWMVKIK